MGSEDCSLVIDGAKDPYANLALEEAIYANNDRRGMTVRVWRNEGSVIIGRAQIARFETDLELCRMEGVPVVRRFTGGGAVFHGPGNLNWSMSVGRDFKAGRIRYVWDAREVFKISAAVVVAAVGRCEGGVALHQDGSMIRSSLGKVSGMAAYLSKDGMFCHGTLLLDANLRDVERFTTPLRETLERRYTRSKPAGVANIGIEPDDFIRSLSLEVSEETGKRLAERGANEEELETMESLAAKYSNSEWNLGDPFKVMGRA